MKSLEEKRGDLRITVAEIQFGMYSQDSLERRFHRLLEAIKDFADEED